MSSRSTPTAARSPCAARNVLVATGGAGQLFAVTTNPPEATGDGIAMALRAGVAVADLEFVQFHPTALHHPAMPRPLLSEALRGHGALLRDADGERFVDELLPRDQVSRAITACLVEQGVEHVWLDATGARSLRRALPDDRRGRARDRPRSRHATGFRSRPPRTTRCGGIVTDLRGASSLPGLWAAGEAACNGVHGANRLASNSLLDGMVFGPRVVEAIDAGADAPEPTGAMRCVLGGSTDIPGRPIPFAVSFGEGPALDRGALQDAMTASAGVVRTAASLAHAAAVAVRPTAGSGRERDEVRNLQSVAQALVAAAAAREETRGAHSRGDFPATDDGLRVRFVTKATAETSTVRGR